MSFPNYGYPYGNANQQGNAYGQYGQQYGYQQPTSAQQPYFGYQHQFSHAQYAQYQHQYAPQYHQQGMILQQHAQHAQYYQQYYQQLHFLPTSNPPVNFTHAQQQNPAKSKSSSSNTQKEQQKQVLECKNCVKTFESQNAYSAHLSAHIKCSYENCTFEGVKKVLREHEECEHAPPTPHPLVQNLRLDTPEEIEKWVRERKKNWPSDRNVERKEQERKERNEMGVLDDTQNKGKGKRKHDGPTNGNDNKKAKTQEEGAKQVCKYFLKGHCKHGKKCKYLHEKPNQPTKSPFPNVKRRPLLRLLLEGEMKKEKNVILQCIRYIVQNNFFESVSDTSRQDQDHSPENSDVDADAVVGADAESHDSSHDEGLSHDENDKSSEHSEDDVGETEEVQSEEEEEEILDGELAMSGLVAAYLSSNSEVEEEWPLDHTTDLDQEAIQPDQDTPPE